MCRSCYDWNGYVDVDWEKILCRRYKLTFSNTQHNCVTYCNFAFSAFFNLFYASSLRWRRFLDVKLQKRIQMRNLFSNCVSAYYFICEQAGFITSVNGNGLFTTGAFWPTSWNWFIRMRNRNKTLLIDLPQIPKLTFDILTKLQSVQECK